MGIIVLKSPQFNSRANIYLASAIFSLSIILLGHVLELSGAIETAPVLGILNNIAFDFLFPVLLFLFFAHYVKHPIRRSKHTVWLYLPFLLNVVFSIIKDLDKTSGLYRIPDALRVIIQGYNILEFFILTFFVPGVLIYSYTMIRTARTREERRWLTMLWLLSISLIISFLAAIVLIGLFDFDMSVAIVLLILHVCLIIYWTAYTGIFKFNLARDQEEIKDLLEKRRKPLLPENNGVTIKENPLTKENQYFLKLEDLCKNHSIYKDSNLDRDKVAETLGISPGYVSQIINTITGNNFATYINTYRVEAVKEIILDSEFDNYSLLAIGLECGFSSKTTFHNSFKKMTGITPNAYRLKHK